MKALILSTMTFVIIVTLIMSYQALAELNGGQIQATISHMAR